MSRQRRICKRRMQRLGRLESFKRQGKEPLLSSSVSSGDSTRGLNRLLFYAGIRLASGHFFALVGVGSALTFGVLQLFLPLSLSLGIAGLVLYFPLVLLQRRVTRRALSFMSDFPTVVLAMATNLKAGLEPYAALRRAVQFFPDNTIVRQEVDSFFARIERGVQRDEALAEFAIRIQLPELCLFRQGLSLVLENGGRFAATLERIARVSRDRAELLQRAQVSTATMRMTAYTLLFVAPVVLSIVAHRTNNFWQIIAHHPVAHTLAMTGVFLIVGSFLVLRRLSALAV